MPLIYLVFLLILSVPYAAWAEKKSFTIMIDPAGDSQYAGREIYGCFERGITLQCAEQLKKTLEYTIPNTRIILTRFPGETVQPLQNASFANRLEVDLYLSIHFFAQKKGPHEIYFYHFCKHPVTDYWKKTPTDLCFVEAHFVHIHSIATSKAWAKELVTVFKTDYKEHFQCTAPLGLPFKPLCGIQAPAIAFEAGLLNAQDWQRYIKPLSQGIETLVKHAKKERKTTDASLS